MIRAVLFDAAGTLIYLPRGVGWHYREIAARHGMEVDEEGLGVAFGKAFRVAAPRVATGISRPDDDKGWWRALVREVFAECGQEPEEGVFGPMFEELYGHFAEPGVWALYPEVPGVLEELHGRYRLAVVSNFDRRLYPILDHLGIRRYFEAIIISSEVGADKPDPRVYATALASLGVAPSEALHAGDDPEHDWRAATAAGIHLYRVDRPAADLSGLSACLRDLQSQRCALFWGVDEKPEAGNRDGSRHDE
jgi:putative hydrolase of the HAD superfamily